MSAFISTSWQKSDIDERSLGHYIELTYKPNPFLQFSTSYENLRFSMYHHFLETFYESDIDISISGKFRIGDIRHNYADLTKIKNMLGFTPKYNFQKGISEFVSWVKTQEVMEDRYEQSVQKLKQKGLMK